jgi:ribose transport system substrate-binding protein
MREVHGHQRRSALSVRLTAVIGALAVLLVLVATGCGDSSDSKSSSSSGTAASGSSDKKYRIGIMIKNTSLPFQGQSIKAFQDGAKKFGFDISIRSGNGKIAQQVNVVQQYVAQKYDMIMMNPSDPEGILPAITMANAANIPVIVVNSAVSPSAKTVCYVGVDDEVFGERQGEALVKAIGDKGNVAVVLGAIGDPPQVQRSAGLKRVLAKHPNIKIVAEQTGNWDDADTLHVVQDFVSRFGPGKLNAIVTQGAFAQTAQWAYSHGRKDVKFIMGDFPASVKEGIAQGYVAASVNQDPYIQGEEAMKIANEYLKNGNKNVCPGGKHLLPLPVVDKANVERYPPGWQG